MYAPTNMPPPKITVCILALLIFWIAPAYSLEYAPPPSYTGSNLFGRDFSGQILRTAEFASANLQSTNFSNVDARGAVFSGSLAKQANFHGADLTYAMLDQGDFSGADFSDAILVESILLRSTFENVDISGADFSDALLDGAQVRELCQSARGVNPKTGVSTRESLSCT